GASLSSDDLINLIKETTMSETKSPAVDALIERHYSPAQRQALAERSFTPTDQTAVEAAWNDIYAEAARLADDGADPGGEPALALARRAQSLIEAFTQRDQGLDASLQAFWEEAQSKPEVMAAMPGTAQSRAFLGAAQAALRSREAG
ncbi:MAG: TipAS antibiotic-recognition domain-containing protein, partial [Pseudomonadota bacterium]